VNQEFEDCLKSGMIVSFTRDENLIKEEIILARECLLDSKATYELWGGRWPTLQSYYTMFHAARALINSKGYRENSHHSLGVALQALFVDEGTMDAQLAQDFLSAMKVIDDENYDQSKTKALIDSAEKFLEKASTILGISE
jgi:uncharacterized protein (UPF0332 family)